MTTRAAALFSLALLGASAALAPRAAGDTRAEELFKDGRKAMKASEYAAALSLMKQSYDLEPAPGTLLNLAECEMHVGQNAAALEHFAEVKNALPPDDKRHQVAAERIQVIAPHVATLTFHAAPGAPPGIAVRRGRAVIALDQPTAFDPGAVALTVTAPGRRDKALSLEPKEGEQQTVNVDAGDAESTAPSPASSAPGAPPAFAPREAPPAGSPKRTLGFVVGGVGLASLGVGAVTGILAFGKASTVKDHCDASLACDPQGLDAGSAGQTLSIVSTVTVIAGLAGVGAGAFLVLTSTKGAAPSAAFVPVVTREGGGLSLTGAF